MNLHQYYPVILHEEGLTYMAGGNVIMGFGLELPEIYSLSEADYEKVHNHWFQALKSLPAKISVHKQDLYLEQNFEGSFLKKDSFLSRATYRHFQGRKYLSHQSHIFFSWPASKDLSKKYANPFRKIPRPLPKDDYGISVFSQAVLEAISYLGNCGYFEIRPLGEEEILDLTNGFFNAFDKDVETDIVTQTDHINIGGRLCRQLIINHETSFGAPLQTSKPMSKAGTGQMNFHQGFLDELGLELPCSHLINQLIYLDDRSRWIKQLEARRMELQKSINFGTQNKIILERIEALLSKINRDENSRIIRGQTSILFYADSHKALSHLTAQIKTVLKELDISVYQPSGNNLQRSFYGAYFGFSDNLPDQDLYVTDLKHALCLWINNTNYRSDSQGILFNDRLNNLPVLKDVWDEQKKRIKARNFAIFAPTGEGKSFLANSILRQFYEQGTRLVVIDLGGSYSKFARLYPNEHVILNYEQGKSLGINPFYLASKDDLVPEHVEGLAEFLLELSATGAKVTKVRQVALKKFILEYYRHCAAPYSLEAFYYYLVGTLDNNEQKANSAQNHFQLEEFLHILSEYVGEGMYSFLFECKEDQVYRLEDKRLIIFELDQVRDNKELLSVMLKLIKSAIQRTIWRNRSEKGMILFDEFAKQLKFENVLESVEFYYQAIRKQNGAIGIILQSINQLPDNSTSASILENTQVIYSLHNEKGYQPIIDRLKLSAHDSNQLNSIRNNLRAERPYTEFFLKIGKQSNVYRLEVPPEVFAAYLTDGKQSDLLDTLYEQQGSMEKAIEAFLKSQKR